MTAAANRTSLAQLDPERRPTKPEVARSNRARGANPLGVAQLAAHLLWEQRVAGSNPAAETTFHPSPRGGIGRRTGLRSRGRKTCPFGSDRGDHPHRRP